MKQRIRFIIYNLITALLAFGIYHFSGYEIDQLMFWLVTMPLIIFMLIAAAFLEAYIDRIMKERG